VRSHERFANLVQHLVLPDNCTLEAGRDTHQVLGGGRSGEKSS
jgi:hypothetical protein